MKKLLMTMLAGMICTGQLLTCPAVQAGDFKVKVHEALFKRLGTRLFEATSEAEMQSLVMVEIGSLMDARESALSQQERQLLVQDIARDVMGLGPGSSRRSISVG